MGPLLLGLAAFGLLNAANAEVRRFERAAAAEIGSKLQGDGKRVSVQAKVGPEGLVGDLHSVTIRASDFATDGLPLYTEPHRSTKGLVRSLRIELTNFSLTGLPVRRLSAEIPDCRFDFALAMRRRQIRVTRSGTGVAEVEVGEKDLEQFIRQKYTMIQRVSVRVDRDKVIVEGFGNFLRLPTEFWVAARLEASEGTKLVLSHARVLLNGKPAEPAFVDALLKVLNPVIDLNRDLKLADAIRVDQVIQRDGALRAKGAIQIPVRPAEAAP